MASAGGTHPGSGRRKSLDAEINLVPFIDLLSMCICFLLMTAVWIQIGSVQIKQSLGTEASSAASDLMEMEVRFSGPTSFELVLKKQNKVIEKFAYTGDNSESLSAKLDTGLGQLKYPGTSFGSATLTPKNGVTYGTMVSVMDILRKHQIVSLGVNPVSGG